MADELEGEQAELAEPGGSPAVGHWTASNSQARQTWPDRAWRGQACRSPARAILETRWQAQALAGSRANCPKSGSGTAHGLLLSGALSVPLPSLTLVLCRMVSLGTISPHPRVPVTAAQQATAWLCQDSPRPLRSAWGIRRTSVRPSCPLS